MLEDILLKGYVPAKGHRLDCALIDNFNLSQNDPAFRARVSDIRQKFLDTYIPLSKRNINISPNLATDCRELGAFFDKSINTIYLCLSFFQSLTDLGRMARVIHELLHAYARLGLDVENWGTQKTMKAGCTVGTKYDSKPEVFVGNADSYEQFVLNLMEGSKEQ